jgi:hypothetical protein
MHKYIRAYICVTYIHVHMHVCIRAKLARTGGLAIKCMYAYAAAGGMQAEAAAGGVHSSASGGSGSGGVESEVCVYEREGERARERERGVEERALVALLRLY